MRKFISALFFSAALAPFATAGSYQPISLNLGGDVAYDGWANITTGNGYTGGSYPGFGPWPMGTGSWGSATPPGGAAPQGVIYSNTSGSGDAFLYKIDNGPNGGPYPGLESLYFGGSTGIKNNKGGTVGIADLSPLGDLQTVTFQIAIAGGYGYEFYNNVTPQLSYTTEAGTFTLSADYTQLLSQVYNGSQVVDTGLEAVYINLWGLQFDLTEIEGEILSLNLTYTAVEHAQVYAMQLDQSTQAYIENAFPQALVWSGSGNWSNSANWSGGSVPASGRDVTFTGNGNTLLDSNRTVGMIKLDAADGFTLSSTNGAVLVSNSGFIADPESAASYTVSAPVRMDEFNIINLGENAELTFSGSITGAGFYKQGKGSLHLTGDNVFSGNQFREILITGGTNTVNGINTNISPEVMNLVIRDGTLILHGGDNRLSSNFSISLFASSSESGGVLINDSATLVLGNEDGAISQTIAGLSAAANKTPSGGIPRPTEANVAVVAGHSSNSTLVIDAATNFSYEGRLGGDGANENNLSLVKRGNGIQSLGGTSTYHGATVIEGGVLLINKETALSANSNLVLDGGMLGLGSGDFNRSLGTGAGQVQFLGDGGFATSGTSRNVNIGGAGATLTWGSGNFIKDGKSLLFSGTNTNHQVRFINGIDLGDSSRSIRVDANSEAALAGVLSGNGGIIKNGAGGLHLTASNSYTGDTVINAGFVAVGGNNGFIESDVVVNSGGNFRIVKTATTNSANHFSDTSSITLNGAGLTTTVSGAANFSETVGDVSLGEGGSSITTNTATSGNTNRLTLGSLSRTKGATLNFAATSIGANDRNQIFINGQANGMIGGWATMMVGNSGDFVTYDSVKGVTALASTISTGPETWGASSNVKYTLAGTRVLDANRSINSLGLIGVSGSATVVDLNSHTLRIATGGLIMNGGSVTSTIDIANGSLTAGTEPDTDAELFVHRTTTAGAAAISANIVDNGTGSVAVVKAGAGALTLSGSNTHSGGTYLNQGTLNINHSHALGSGTLILARGITLNNNSGESITVAGNNQQVWKGDFTFTGTGHDLNLGTGTVTLAADVQVAVNGTRTLTVGGGIVGDHSLTKAGLSTLVLGGNNSYTGNTAVTSGTLTLAQGGAMSGNGNITVANKATFRVDGSVTGAGTLILERGSRLEGSGTIARSFTVGRGVTIAPGNSPGTLSTGSQTWEGGATYLWSINSAEAGEGIGWSSLDIDGTLTLTASSNDQFKLEINSLTAANIPGLVEGFNSDTTYQWKILTASEGIIGFDADAFTLNIGLFDSILDPSHFYVSQDGNSLYLNVIPEPGTWAMMVLGGGGLLWHLRRRKSAQSA